MKEWTNEIKSMNDALRALNIILLELPDLEESAFDEAKNVKHKLDLGILNKKELVDYLNQAAIDLLVYKRRI